MVRKAFEVDDIETIKNMSRNQLKKFIKDEFNKLLEQHQEQKLKDGEEEDDFTEFYRGSETKPKLKEKYKEIEDNRGFEVIV